MPGQPTRALLADEDDGTATRAAYLRAATRLVNEHGYRGASVDRIAAELRLTKGSFYHHHETKEELIAACFERTFAVVRAAQSAALASPGSGLERLAMACRSLLDFQMSPQGPLLRVTAWTGLPAALRDDTRRTMGRLGERFAALVVEGMADGSLRIVDPSIAAQVVNGLVNAAAELERWVPGAHAGNAFELYATPLFGGLQAGCTHPRADRGDKRHRCALSASDNARMAAAASHPAAEPLPDFNALPDLIGAHARAQPHATALIDGGGQMDYAALDAAMDRVAATLQRDGAKPGDTIAICALACNAYVGAVHGRVARRPRGGAAGAEQHAGADRRHDGRLGRAPPVSRCRQRAGRAGRAHRRACNASASTSRAATRGCRTGWRLRAASRRRWRIDPQWAFNIIYSSGTTGTPKGIVQPHVMRWSQIRRAEAGGYGPSSVTLIATPLYSNTTLVVVIPTLARGGALVLMPKFDCASYLALAEKHRATHTMLVPVQYQRLMAWPEFDRFDLSSFQFKACTSAPFRAELKAEVLRRWPGGLTEYYGMTEGGGSCILYCHLYPEQAAHGGPAGRGPRHPLDRRRRPRTAAPPRRDRRGGRPLGGDDDRVPQPARQDRARPSGTTHRGAASSAPATSAASTKTAS